MGTLVIKDFDTAFDAYISSWTDGFSWDDVKLSDEAALTVKLEGEQWDGKIDYKIAEFVVRLQKAFVTAYNAQSGEKIKYNTLPMDRTGLRVVVTVSPGCSCIKVFFKEMWANMESKDKKYAVIAMALIFAIPAGLGFWHYCDTQTEIAKISAEAALKKFQEEKKAEIKLAAQSRLRDEAIRKDAMHAIDRAFDLVEHTNSSVAYLTGKMQKEDSMTVDQVRVPAEVAARLFKPAKSTDTEMKESFYILDGEYIVSGIDREKEVVTIRFEDKKRKFSLVWLEGAALETFYKSCARPKADGQLLPIPLQLKATFVGGVFKSGFVQGVGSKREGAMTFAEATLDSARRQEEIDMQSEDE